MQVLYINLLEIKYLRKHTVVFRENRHRTSIFHCKSCAKTGIQSCAKSDSGAKFSLKITGRFSFMFQQPFRRETEIENFSNHMQFAERSGMNPVEVVECFQEAFWKEITPGARHAQSSLRIAAPIPLMK